MISAPRIAMRPYAIKRTPRGFVIHNVRTGEDVVICDTAEDAVDVADRLNDLRKCVRR